jgi:hypothetical protein
MKSADFPIEAKEQLPFVQKKVEEYVSKVLNRTEEFTVKLWNVEKRRLARNSTEVMIPAVEVLFPDKPEVAIEFRKGASSRARSREKGYEGVFFSLFVNLQTRVRIEVAHDYYFFF